VLGMQRPLLRDICDLEPKARRASYEKILRLRRNAWHVNSTLSQGKFFIYFWKWRGLFSFGATLVTLSLEIFVWSTSWQMTTFLFQVVTMAVQFVCLEHNYFLFSFSGSTWCTLRVLEFCGDYHSVSIVGLAFNTGVMVRLPEWLRTPVKKTLVVWII